MHQQTFRRDRITWLAYFMVALVGFFMNVLGPLTPYLKSELNLSYTVSSLHFTANALGLLIMGLTGHFIVEKLGRIRSLWIGSAGFSLGGALLIVGTSPVVTILGAFLMGLIGSLILVIVPATLSEMHGENRGIAISEANVMASFITALGPLLVGFFASTFGNWRYGLGIMVLAPLFLYFGLGRGVSIPQPKVETDQPASHEKLPFRYWLFWLAIVLSVSLEFCMVSWSADFFEKVLSMTKDNAVQAVSAFFIAMIVGRYLGSVLVRHFSIFWLILVNILIATAGFLLFWKSGVVLLSILGLFLAGLGIASLYPLLLSMAIGSAGNNTVQASAGTTLASGLAVLLLPLILGRLADFMGIAAAYGVVIVLLLVDFGVVLFAKQLSSRQIPKQA